MTEAAFRFSIFLIVFALIGLAEVLWPRRKPSDDKARRWRTNLGLVVVNVLAQRLTLGAIAFAAALYAGDKGWGLFNLVALPLWLEGAITLVILDAAIYLQHVATHKVPLLWRLHRVHHADLDVDVTTGLRFHPIEILLSLLYKATLVLALGADPLVVLIFEALLNAATLFTHGNIALPIRWDSALRWIICTPDMHRRHHSVVRVETDSNYGNVLSLWDRLCGTYFQQPALGQDGVVLGQDDLRDGGQLGLFNLLKLPLTKPMS
nr:sterol desaturase family protein [uncultured Dongia sp.]